MLRSPRSFVGSRRRLAVATLAVGALAAATIPGGLVDAQEADPPAEADLSPEVQAQLAALTSEKAS
ncbi:MAG: hypothetical protein KDA97_02100, partial [Acidimicrobiales bacterium]|nr:hypothetical protein [Acidimicrobiales bacterium]